MPRSNKQNNDRPPLYQVAFLAMLIPMLMLAGPIVGYFLGSWVDKQFGWSPIGQLIGLLLGLLAGFRESYMIIKRLIDIQK